MWQLGGNIMKLFKSVYRALFMAGIVLYKSMLGILLCTAGIFCFVWCSFALYGWKFASYMVGIFLCMAEILLCTAGILLYIAGISLLWTAGIWRTCHDPSLRARSFATESD